MAEFKVVSEYSPAGDQPQAIAALAEAHGLTNTPFYDYGKNYRGSLLRPLVG